MIVPAAERPRTALSRNKFSSLDMGRPDEGRAGGLRCDQSVNHRGWFYVNGPLNVLLRQGF